MSLPQEVVAEDQRLDADVRAKQLELARLRWHWTLDEDNPDRVSFRAYGAAVGRSDRAIGNVVNGYANWLAEQSANDIVRTPRSLTDHIEMAKTSDTKRQAAQAIADAEGVTVSNVLGNRRETVRDVIHAAQEKAERRGTTVEEELPKQAAQNVADRRREAEARERAQSKHTLRWLSVEAALGKAQTELKKALAETEGVEFTDQEREFIADVIGRLRATLNLLDIRVLDATDINWDAELAKMGDAK